MATLTDAQTKWLAKLGGIVGSAGGSTPPAMSKEEAAFRAERDAVAKLADALRADPQAARIRAQLIDIGTRQGSAPHHAARRVGRGDATLPRRAPPASRAPLADSWAVRHPACHRERQGECLRGVLAAPVSPPRRA